MLFRAMFPLGVAACLLLATDPVGAETIFVDWQSVGSGGVTGILFGSTVSFSGAGAVNPAGTGPTNDYTILNWTAQDFANASVFTPAIQFTDAVSFFGATQWTIDFGHEVLNPIIHFTNFARTISGFSVAPQIISSNGGVGFDGVTLRSPLDASTTSYPLPQSEGTLLFSGRHRTIRFTPGTEEQLVMQFGASVVPEPASLFMSAIGAVAAYVMGKIRWRRMA